MLNRPTFGGHITNVGTLIQRKYPMALVTAMNNALGKDFLLSYAGEGQEQESIKAEAERWEWLIVSDCWVELKEMRSSACLTEVTCSL